MPVCGIEGLGCITEHSGLRFVYITKITLYTLFNNILNLNLN